MGLHCIASLVYNPPDRRKVYDFAFKLNFDNIKPRYPGRAVFSVRSKNSNWNPRSLDVSTFKRKTFERLRAEAGSGRLGEADKSVPGSRIRLFESPVRMFVVQVRGSVGDCALPALNIDHGKRELSCEWRDLFDRFFGERRITTTVLNSAPVDQVPTHTRDYHLPQQNFATFNVLVSQLDPSLQPLARLDWHTHIRHMEVSKEGAARIQRLKNPIQTWTDAMGEEFGQAKATLRKCRFRRQANQEIDLDDEGDINQARLEWEAESNAAADSRGRAEWYPLIRACDSCRITNRRCERGDSGNGFPPDCDSCISIGFLCKSSLACLNNSRPHYVSPDYQMQLMLLEQQNRTRLLTARQVQDTVLPPCTRSVFPRGNHALQDYQMQMMLLEQQNKKRLIMARQQPNSTGPPPSQLPPIVSGSLRTPSRSSASASFEMHHNAQSDDRRLFEARHAPVDSGQNPRSGPSEPASDNQAPLPVHRQEEQPMEIPNIQDPCRRGVQPLTGYPFTPMPAPTAELSRAAGPSLSDGCSKP